MVTEKQSLLSHLLVEDIHEREKFVKHLGQVKEKASSHHLESLHKAEQQEMPELKDKLRLGLLPADSAGALHVKVLNYRNRQLSQ